MNYLALLQLTKDFKLTTAQFCTLTGLAQSSVVRITPINGVRVIIRSVNFGKYSCDKTGKNNQLK